MIAKRIEQLRELMCRKGLQAWYINGSDPHLSEYLPERWQSRRFISGFSGSYGQVVITLDDAALWTDSRYFLQAENELKGTGIRLMKARLPETPLPEDWLCTMLPANSCVGTDAACISRNMFGAMRTTLDRCNIRFMGTNDLLDEVWTNRPPMPDALVINHTVNFAGKSRSEKIEEIRQGLAARGADVHLLIALDDIAWTFNLRGSDIECNPVFLSHALISTDEATLFIQQEKLSVELQEQLHAEHICLKPYKAIYDALKALPAGTRVFLDQDKTNQSLVEAIPAYCAQIHGITLPCLQKACKNTTEVANIRRAMQKDGVALVKFLHWIENTIGKQPVSEFDVAEKLTEFRSEQENFMGNSFYPIVGYKEHGAIVHFHVEKDNALELHTEGILLIDSGAHYPEGTTDTTRTIALGEPSAQQKTDFTLALKGVIALTCAVFPENTKGCHLDILARKALWKHGLNYGHGTGHGIGFFLNVHEGPMSIRQEYNDQAIREGMVLSNEPAFYRTGQYGIRTENVMVCVEKQTTAFGRFLGFETLTLCPIDLRLIDLKLLDQQEIDWLNSYHHQVYCELGPALTDELCSFLKEKTTAIAVI